MSEVGLSIAVTKDSRDSVGSALAEQMLRAAMSRRFPAATDLEIHWLWDEASGFIDDEGDPIPPYWLVMITGQTP